MKREDLEAQAKQAVCSCWYYDLADDIDSVSDEDLRRIIEYPPHFHIMNQIHNPVSGSEFIEELLNCSDTDIKELVQ